MDSYHTVRGIVGYAYYLGEGMGFMGGEGGVITYPENEDFTFSHQTNHSLALHFFKNGLSLGQLCSSRHLANQANCNFKCITYKIIKDHVGLLLQTR